MTSPASILIVEDEPLIAMMLEDFLDLLGHRVGGTAETVAAARTAVAAGGIDAAILDLNLKGGEPSWPVADALADAGIPFVLATGGHVANAPPRHAGAPTLPKPFTMDGVESALDQLLAEDRV